MFVFLASGILEDGSVAFLSYEFLYKLFLKQNCFFNEGVCFFGFRHSGRRFRGFFSYEFISFFGTELFFLMRMFDFLASGILEDGSVAFFSYEFISFFGTELFFYESVCFLASGIVEDGSVAFFSCEFISFFGTELFFQWECLFFWLQAFWKTVL